MNETVDSLTVGGAFIAGLLVGVIVVLRVIKAVREALDDDDDGK